jgi:hypothetical protein
VHLSRRTRLNEECGWKRGTGRRQLKFMKGPRKSLHEAAASWKSILCRSKPQVSTAFTTRRFSAIKSKGFARGAPGRAPGPEPGAWALLLSLQNGLGLMWSELVALLHGDDSARDHRIHRDSSSASGKSRLTGIWKHCPRRVHAGACQAHQLSA